VRELLPASPRNGDSPTRALERQETRFIFALHTSRTSAKPQRFVVIPGVSSIPRAAAAETR
jgi:hypothetical protein